jgi:hypothetical protein
MKSHFEDEERLRERGKNSGEKDFGQIHIRKSHFADEERLRETKRGFGENTSL